MKVLLCQDIEELGWLGDVVEVKDGYARNYLLPQRLAKVPTEANIKSLAEAKVAAAEKRIAERSRLEEAATAVEGAEAVIAAKANELGHLFGSVTEKQIAENLREQGLLVADEIVRIKSHIKEVGTHEVQLRFASDLKVSVNVVVVSENSGQEDASESADEQKSEAVEQGE